MINTPLKKQTNKTNNKANYHSVTSVMAWT